MLLLGDLIEIPTIAVKTPIRGADGATWPAHEVIEGKPHEQFVAPNSPTLSIDLYLHVAFIAPRPFITKLRQISTSGQVFDLYTRAGSYWGRFKLGDVSFAYTWTLDDGRVLAATCTLNLGDPGLDELGPREQPLALLSGGGPAPLTIVTDVPPEDTSTPIEEVSPEQIARL